MLEKFNKFFKDSEIKGDKIIYKSDPFETLEFIKDTYQFEILKDIQITPLENNKLEVNYVIDNIEDEETGEFVFVIENTLPSMVKLFDNAGSMEKKISEQFGIKIL